eukprot:6224328-Pyramimonas_sp.AAC.1
MKSGRKTLLIDDAVNAIAFTTEQVPEKDLKPALHSRVLVWCLEFGITGTVLFPDIMVFREPTWISFILHPDGATDHCEEGDGSANIPEVISAAILERVGSSNFKVFDCWRKLRPRVKKCIAAFYEVQPRADDRDFNQVDDDDDQEDEPKAKKAKTSDAKFAKQCEEQGVSWAELKRVLHTLSSGPGILTTIVGLIKNNPPVRDEWSSERALSLTKRVHRTYSVESSALFRHLSDANTLKSVCSSDSADAGVKHLISVISGIVFEGIPPAVISVLCDFLQGTNGAGEEQVSVLITICPKFRDIVAMFRQHTNIKLWLKTRTLHALGLLEDSISGITDMIEMSGLSEESLTHKDAFMERLQKAKCFIVDTLDNAALADLQCDSQDDWADRWHKLVKQGARVGPLRMRTDQDWQQVERGLTSKRNSETLQALKEKVEAAGQTEQCAHMKKKEEFVKFLVLAEVESKKKEESSMKLDWDNRVEELYKKIVDDSAEPSDESQNQNQQTASPAEPTETSLYAPIAWTPTHYVESKMWKCLTAAHCLEGWLTENFIARTNLRHLHGRLDKKGDFKRQGLFFKTVLLDIPEAVAVGASEGAAPEKPETEQKEKEEQGKEQQDQKEQKAQVAKEQEKLTFVLQFTGKVVPCMSKPPMTWKRFYKCGEVLGVSLYLVPEQNFVEIGHE